MLKPDPPLCKEEDPLLSAAAPAPLALDDTPLPVIGGGG
jgi:hypothetical protein